MTHIERTYSPTVFVIDDDFSVRQMIRQKFHGETSIGVIVSRTLSEARKIVDDEDIEFDAVMADIVFEQGTDDPKHDIHDGIDLLTYLLARRPLVSQYVISCWADVSSYHDRAKKLGLKITDWFQKLSFGICQDVKSPWSKIERDLIKKALLSDHTFEERAKELQLTDASGGDIEALSERARCSLIPTIRTYIQELNEDFTVSHPIEVYCRYINQNQVVAAAIKLGLLQEGQGETVEEALDDLKGIIVEQKVFFQKEDKNNVVGYAKLAMERLDHYVKKKSR